MGPEISAAITKRCEWAIGASAADRKLWQVFRVAEERRRLSREAQGPGIKSAFMFAHVRLQEARKAQTKIEYRGAGERVSVIVAKAGVSAGKEVARGLNAVDHAGPIIARLYAVVEGEAK